MGVRKAEKNGAEEPVFDYSKWSYKAQKYAQKLRIKLQRNSQKIDAADPAMPDKDYEALCKVSEDLEVEIAFSMTRHIVSVPREWLMANAPEKLDWSKPETADYLRADRVLILQIAAAEARSPESVSGN